MQLTFPHRETWLHRLNPSLKLIVSVALFVFVVCTKNLTVTINLTITTLLPLLFFSGHPAKRLLLYASPFLLVFISSSTGMMMFGEGSVTWLRFGPVHVTQESFWRGLLLGFRALQVAAAGLLFGLTTKPVALFYSLMQQWKLAPKYAYSFLAALRMVPIIFEEFQTLRYALRVRGRKKRHPLTGWYESLRMYVIPLLVQSIRRAHRTAVAMEAKRFSNERNRTYYYQYGYSALDAVYVLYFAMAALISVAAGAYWPYAPF